MSLPWNDWQFWVVTLACAWGAWAVARPFVGMWKRRDTSEAASCPGCNRCDSAATEPAGGGTGLVQMGGGVARKVVRGATQAGERTPSMKPTSAK